MPGVSPGEGREVGWGWRRAGKCLRPCQAVGSPLRTQTCDGVRASCSSSSCSGHPTKTPGSQGCTQSRRDTTYDSDSRVTCCQPAELEEDRGGSRTEPHSIAALSFQSTLYPTVISSPLEKGCCCLVTQSCPTLCEPVDCSTPGFPVLHHHPELAQTHVH